MQNRMVAKKGGTANTNWSKTIRNSNTSQSGEVDEHLRQEAFEIDYDLARKKKGNCGTQHAIGRR